MNKKINENWRFMLGNISEAVSSEYDDSKWRSLDVPHDWSIEGEYSLDNPSGARCGYLPTGIAFYRKVLEIDKSWHERDVQLVFNGVFRNSTVYVDGIELGTRVLGWGTFMYNISRLIEGKGHVVVVVRVDNSRQPAARWYTGSGIYADVELIVRERCHIALNETFVRTRVQGSCTDIEISCSIHDPKNEAYNIISEIYDAENKLLGKYEGSENSRTIRINNIKLWSPENPYLHTLVNTIVKCGRKLDSETIKIGAKTIVWKSESGFWLNGINTKIRGVCNHNDAGSLGVAVPEKIMSYRLQQLKNMGANAIRTTHNQQIPLFYDLCDEMGIMVLNEFCDGWTVKAEQDYGHDIEKCWENDLTEFVKRDRNHACVIAWSIGNETNGLLGEQMVEKIHQLDPDRLVTGGQTNNDYMDIIGLNGTCEFKGFSENYKVGDKAFIATEAPHTWHVRGFYKTQTWYRDGDKVPHYDYDNLTEKEVFEDERPYMSSYDNATVRISTRQNIIHSRDYPWYAGEFRWTLHDYLGEGDYVSGGWPFKAFTSGVIDLCNFPKDSYYLYQSQWTKEPMIHILPHWTHHNIGEGTQIPVVAYSNCHEVELFINGKSLGRQRLGRDHDEMQGQWLVPWQAGTIRAIGIKNGKTVCEISKTTSQEPVKLRLSSDTEKLNCDKNDIAQVTVETIDENGVPYPHADTRVFFDIKGAGRLRALDNGAPDDVEPHCFVNSKKCFMGLAKAFVVPNGEVGPVTLAAGSIFVNDSNRVSIDVTQISLRGKLPLAEIKIFYTLNGKEPDENSIYYTGSFYVKKGALIKACVYYGEENLFTMQA